MKDRHKFCAAAYLVVLNGGKVLCGKRKNTGYFDGSYGLPSGHIEAGEAATAAVLREAREEAGIILRPEDIKFSHMVMYKRDGLEYFDIFFKTENYKGGIENMEPHKCESLDWLDIRRLPANVAPEVGAALENMLRGNYYSELGF
ncbi:MAG: NUDIX domain-containing protein [Rickettsiales bacterium]|nr:NUDIX domain-containing protein [Rickettsiales bacterium]